jgi:hypothetical protein
MTGRGPGVTAGYSGGDPISITQADDLVMLFEVTRDTGSG